LSEIYETAYGNNTFFLELCHLDNT